MIQYLNMQVHWKGGFPGKTKGLFIEYVGPSSPRKLCCVCRVYIEVLDFISFKITDTDRLVHSFVFYLKYGSGPEKLTRLQKTGVLGRSFALSDVDSFSKVKTTEYYPSNHYFVFCRIFHLDLCSVRQKTYATQWKHLKPRYNISSYRLSPPFFSLISKCESR